ncbi:MAG: methyltransferase domain-containing protein [Acuticoccus sp.]
MAIGGEFTERLLRDAGLVPGMRVLDLGCGNGDVSLIAAGLVGPAGSVVGIDRNADALAAARERAREPTAPNGAATVTFHAASLDAVPDLGAFDAIVARRVLMYLPNPAAVLEGLLPMLRPGGRIAIHEHDTTMVPAALAEMPLHRTVQEWLRAMLAAERADLHMGFHLHATLTDAGFTVESVRAEAIVQTPTQRYQLAEIVAAVHPRITAHGIATDDEIGLSTLFDRLEAERLGSGATYVGDMMVGAIGHRPA